MEPAPILSLASPALATPSSATLRQCLREQTAEAHARLDRLATHYDLLDDRDIYRFCAWMRCGFQELERRILLSGAQSLFPGWRPLLPNLSGLSFHPQNVRSPELRGRGLGMLYVHTGSQLGASVMRRRYPALTTYAPELFETSGNGWPAFISVLDAELQELALQSAAVNSANAAFQIFVDQHSFDDMIGWTPIPLVDVGDTQ